MSRSGAARSRRPSRAAQLDEFKRRQEAGKVKKLGYEDQQPTKARWNLPLPMASFGVGGEFGVGGKYDNGERFDLRLPYVDEGWVEEKPRKAKRPEPKAKGGVKPGPRPAAGPLEWLFGGRK